MKWNRALRDMKPYIPGKTTTEVKTLYGLDEVVKLASNENPYGCSPTVQSFLKTLRTEFEIYPDGHASVLRAKLSDRHNVEESSILFGNGSDEIISIITRALLDENLNTIMAIPTFPQYAHNARIQGAEIREIPLHNGQHDLDGMSCAIDANTSVIWLCSPNNPTGNLIPSKALRNFLEQIRLDILVVIDEAYFEYISDESYIDSVHLLQEFQNVIILRTFSKAFGLASLRIGYGIGHPSVISELNKVRNPFNANTNALLIAEKALDDMSFIQQCRELNHIQSLRLQNFAAQHDLHIFDTEANFVLIAVDGDADDAAKYLLQRGYIVRSGNALGTPGYIRVTIGTQVQNTGFMATFNQYLKNVRGH